MGIKIEGLDELSKKLKRLENNAKRLNGEHTLPMSEVLTNSFLTKHTRFGNMEEMIEASGLKVETNEDFSAIPDDEWDEFINSVSSFSNWQELLQAAGNEWAAKQLKL